MSQAQKHLFQFNASAIAAAAKEEAAYHEDRIRYWQSEYDASVKRVEETIGAKIVKQQVTGGYRIDVRVDYGDTVAYHRMEEAYNKIDKHRKAAEQFHVESQVYGTQGDRAYDLDSDDVQHFRLGGQAREE